MQRQTTGWLNTKYEGIWNFIETYESCVIKARFMNLSNCLDRTKSSKALWCFITAFIEQKVHDELYILVFGTNVIWNLSHRYILNLSTHFHVIYYFIIIIILYYYYIYFYLFLIQLHFTYIYILITHIFMLYLFMLFIIIFIYYY